MKPLVLLSVCFLAAACKEKAAPKASTPDKQPAPAAKTQPPKEVPVARKATAPVDRSTPQGVAKGFIEAAAKGDIERSLDFMPTIEFCQMDPPTIRSGCEKRVALYQANMPKYLGSLQGAKPTRYEEDTTRKMPNVKAWNVFDDQDKRIAVVHITAREDKYYVVIPTLN